MAVYRYAGRRVVTDADGIVSIGPAGSASRDLAKAPGHVRAAVAKKGLDLTHGGARASEGPRAAFQDLQDDVAERVVRDVRGRA